MEKRKLKVNVIDIAIIVAILCSITVIVFRDVIHDAFGNPEIVELSVTVDVGEALVEEFGFEENDTVALVLDGGNGASISMTVDSFEETSLNFVCNGYKKLGRFYTESGELIELGSGCEFESGETSYSVTVKTIGTKGE
jgi:hypothetical protein